MNGDALTIQGATIRGALRWHALANRPIGRVIFAHARVGRLIDDRGSWPEPGKLFPNGFVYDSLGPDAPNISDRLEWLKLQPKGEWFSLQPYEHLARVLRAMGHLRGAHKIAIAREEAFIANHYCARFLRITVGYGYEPWLVLMWFLGLVVFGIIIFEHADREGAMVPVREAIATSPAYLQDRQVPPGYPKFYSVIYSLDVALPIVDLEQQGYWAPSQDIYPGPFAQWWLWIEILCGWLLAAVGLAAITGIIKRD